MGIMLQRKRSGGRPFVKGMSGNPGGRPKTDPAVITLLKAATPLAAQLLIDIMNDEHTPQRLRLMAAEAILDRVYGRATQPIEASIGGTGEPVTITFEGALDKWSV